ncbi:cell adhesion molecule CEACAM2 [Neosynchiropus ocellatus]
MEDKNVSLSCTWTAGTDLTVQWGKGGQTISSDSRITIAGGSLVINPARRGDAGDYTCTVSNPVSARTATASLTVYYGPDGPVVTKDTPKDCVGGGDVLVGQTVRITCTSDSLPPALFSWTLGGQSVATGQPDSGVLSLQTLSTDESGRYVCTARNGITGNTAEQGTNLSIVDVCLSGGEVAGIVIGSFLLLLILILLIILLVKKIADQRRRRDELLVPKNDANPRPPRSDRGQFITIDRMCSMVPRALTTNTNTTTITTLAALLRNDPPTNDSSRLTEGDRDEDRCQQKIFYDCPAPTQASGRRI